MMEEMDPSKKRLDYLDVVCEKLRFKNIFRKADIFKFLRFEVRRSDWLVWTVGLTVEIKLRFQISILSSYLIQLVQIFTILFFCFLLNFSSIEKIHIKHFRQCVTPVGTPRSSSKNTPVLNVFFTWKCGQTQSVVFDVIYLHSYLEHFAEKAWYVFLQ